MNRSNANESKYLNKQKIVIIGGGPGGAACALALYKLAKERFIDINIIVLEGKNFIQKQHHNQCVGVLSPPLPSLLEKSLGVPFPRNLCIGNIESYILHSAGEKVSLNDNGEPSIAVQRVEFDAYMLDQVSNRNIKVLPFRAVDLEFHSNSVIVYTENESVEADIVVGAFGMDDGSAAMFARATPYRQPRALDSIIVNLPTNNNDKEIFGTNIHAFLPKNHLIEFGAITPKCDHLTINIAGKEVNTPLMWTFLENPEIIECLQSIDSVVIPTLDNLRYYKGRFPRSLARDYYGDRYVMVGDASGLVRAFKGKGATSAIQTGIRAANTIINHGGSAQAFRDHYQSANQDIINDLPYGHSIRLITLLMSDFGLMGMVLRAAKKSPALKNALFGAVSGHKPYHDVFTEIFRPNVIWTILSSLRKESPQKTNKA